jgi:murein DD-endopeptidase MepM/ murein hydrolase activator NlpD
LKPGQEAIADASKARTKRVKGLPSTFVLSLSDDTLKLEPLNVIRTTGLPQTLNRVWLVDSVKHAISAGTTTLECYSPIEVIVAANSSQPISPTNTADKTVDKNVVLNAGGYIWAAHGIVTSLQGMRKHPVTGVYKMHGGTDIGVPIGTPVVAGKDGIVTKVAFQDKGAGRYITIDHKDSFTTTYMHLSRQDVTIGQQVKQGQVIGLSGNTGIGSGPHLHYEFRCNGAVVSPSRVGLTNPVKGGNV